MKINTLKFAALFAFVISFLGINTAKATHFAAADLYMEFVGDASNQLRYKIVVNVYKACEPGNASLSFKENIRLWSVNGGMTTTWSVLGTNPVEDTLDQLCAGFKSQNSCRQPGSQFPAFVRRTYDTTIDLQDVVTYFPGTNPRQTDWKISWTSSARNGGIANLVNPQQALYIEGGLNNVTNFTNSTPRFTIDPLPYICVNLPASYLNDPVDVDNDSLDTKNQAPLIAQNSPMTHLAPYTLANPVNSPASNPYTVDALTGMASFTPSATGKFVLAFRCDEYQRVTGIPTGYIMRDVQLSVLPCNALPPAVDSIPINIQFGVVSKKDGRSKLLTCPNNTVSFDITSSSNSISNKVYLQSTASTAIPGSTFNVANNGTSKVTGTFTWTPTQADIGEHTFTAISSDSTCDINIAIVLKSYSVITIKVIDGLEAGEDVTVCPIGGASAQLFVRGAEGLKVKWTDIDGGPAVGLSADDIIDPLAKPWVHTVYTVFSPDLPGYCKNKDTLTVFMDTTNKVNVLPENPVILCRPDYLQLDAIPFGKAPITNMSCGAGNPSSVTVVDSLTVLSLLSTQSFDTATAGGSPAITFPNDVASVKQQFLVRRSELAKTGILSSTFRSLSFEVKAGTPAPTFEYNNFRIGIKCTDKNALDAVKGFETGVTTVYTAPGPVTMPGGWQQFVFDETYNWDSSKNLIIEICYSANAAPLPAGNYPIIRFVPTNYVANLTLKGGPDVCNAVTNAAIGANFSRPLFNFTFNEAPSVPFKYTWFPGTLLSDSTIQQPLAYLPRSQKYTVETIGRSGCIVRDSADVYIPTHNYSVWPADTAICFGEPAPLHTKDGFTYKWYEYKDGVYTLLTRNSTCWDCADPILTPTATTIYKIVVYDSVWCTDTLTARVEVMPLPDVKILNRDTIVKYGQGIQLLVSGARTYNWFQVGSMSNTNISNPIARPTERTDYVVGGIGKNGCRSYDTVTVDVDFRDNLFIPSAFSPNGDGKNDVFRISNLSFQRVLEFRVFNRWGQEVFYSNDNQHGWDGKWKGVPQDLGSYQYLIRLGYPDGLVETYKGELTLVK